jgi:drug/metabolite transporter (DMT)-like permease
MATCARVFPRAAAISPSPSSSGAILVPVIGVISSVLLLDEHLTVGIGLGGALVLAGLWLVQRGAHVAAPRDAPAIPPAAAR